MVKPGDSIPSVELLEGSPDKKVNLAQELASGKGVIVGVPAAFSQSRFLYHHQHRQLYHPCSLSPRVAASACTRQVVQSPWQQPVQRSNAAEVSFRSSHS